MEAPEPKDWSLVDIHEEVEGGEGQPWEKYDMTMQEYGDLMNEMASSRGRRERSREIDETYQWFEENCEMNYSETEFYDPVLEEKTVLRTKYVNEIGANTAWFKQTTKTRLEDDENYEQT